MTSRARSNAGWRKRPRWMPGAKWKRRKGHWRREPVPSRRRDRDAAIKDQES